MLELGKKRKRPGKLRKTNMNDTLSKVAELTPASMLAMSVLGGAGGYAGLRLLRDMMQQVHPPKHETNSVKLMLPNPIQGVPEAPIPQSTDKMAVDLDSLEQQAPEWWQNPLAVATGVPVGFLGAKGLYDHFQASQEQHKVDAAKKQYMAQLIAAQAGNQKIAEETPFIDSCCEAAASELTKSAGPIDIANGVANMYSRFAPTWAGGLPNPPADSGLSIADIQHNTPLNAPDYQEAGSQINHNAKEGLSDLANLFSLNGAHTGKIVAEGIAGGVALGGLGWAINNYNKRKEKEQKAQYPMRVDYAGK